MQCHNESIYKVYSGLLEVRVVLYTDKEILLVPQAKFREEMDVRKLENFELVKESCNFKV